MLVSAGNFLPLAGGSADWYQDHSILRGTESADITVGSPVATLNGTPRRLAAASFLVGNKLYIPLQLALEVLDLPGNTDEGETGSSDPSPRKPGTGAMGVTPDLRLPPLSGETGFHFRYYPVYDIQASYDPEKGEIQGELFLAYQNPYQVPLWQLYFNLPANVPFGNGATLTVAGVAVNNQPVNVRLKDGQLEVLLPQILAPKETLSLALSFKTTVPPGNTRQSRDGNLSMVAGWYPILAPRTGEGWAGMARTTYGDPYFADAAYYQVHLYLPSGYQVLASSRLTSCQDKGEWTDCFFNSEQPVREFAFTAAPSWRFTTCQAGAVQLVAADRGETVRAALQVASQALNFFQEIYGPFPARC